MGAIVHELEDGGMMLNVEAWSHELCDRGGCDGCPHDRDFGPVVTFFYNCGVAVALAAELQRGARGTPIAFRHRYRQNQIEKLRHALTRIENWAEPVRALSVEAEEMHREVERLRAALVYITTAGVNPVDVARRALNGDT